MAFSRDLRLTEDCWQKELLKSLAELLEVNHQIRLQERFLRVFRDGHQFNYGALPHRDMSTKESVRIKQLRNN